MADEVMFGTPETWGMKVGQFIEEKENILPQPKPQDIIEQRRKDSLRKFLFDYPGAVEQETVDYIKREELAKGTGGSFKDYINRGEECQDLTFEEWLREDKAEGGRIGFSRGGFSELTKLLNNLPDGTEVTRDMVQKLIDDNNLDVTVRNYFARPSKDLKGGITLSKRMPPIKITDELLKNVDNYIKNTPLDLKAIGEEIGYKPTKKGQSGQLRSTSPLIKEYEAKYGKIPEGRFKPYKLTEGSDYVQNIIKLREELGSTNAVSKQLKLNNKTIRNALKAGNRFDLIGPVNVPGPIKSKLLCQ